MGMEMINAGVLVIGILLVRKLAWNSISRKLQYGIWIFAGVFFLLNPFVSVTSRFSVESMVAPALGYFNIDYISQATDVGPNGLNDTNELLNGSTNNSSSNSANEDIKNSSNNSASGDTKNSSNNSTSAGTDNSSNNSASVGIDNSLSNSASTGTDNSLDNIANETASHTSQTAAVSASMQQDALSKDTKDGMGLVSAINWRSLYILIRWGVAAGIILYILISNIRFWLYCRKNRRIYQKGTAQQLQVYVLENINSPFLFGRDIYVSPAMTENAEEFLYMRQHETCHYEHHDMIWMCVRFLCVSLNWYNPFVWLAVYYVKQDCELACDESVLKTLGADNYQAYGQTLIALLRNQKRGSQKFSIATSMSCSKTTMKMRIHKIKDMRNTNKAVMAVVLVFLLCLTGCTVSKKVDADTTTENNGVLSNATESIIDIFAKKPSQIQLPDSKELTSIQMDRFVIPADRYNKDNLDKIYDIIQSAKGLSQADAKKIRRGDDYFVITLVYADENTNTFFFFVQDDVWYMEKDSELYTDVASISEVDGVAIDSAATWFGVEIGAYYGSTAPDPAVLQYGIDTDFDIRYEYLKMLSEMDTSGGGIYTVGSAGEADADTSDKGADASNEDTTTDGSYEKTALLSSLKYYDYAINHGFTIPVDDYEKIVAARIEEALSQENYKEVEKVYESAGITLEDYLRKLSQTFWLRQDTVTNMRKQITDEYRAGNTTLNGENYKSATEYWNAYMNSVITADSGDSLAAAMPEEAGKLEEAKAYWESEINK